MDATIEPGDWVEYVGRSDLEWAVTDHDPRRVISVAPVPFLSTTSCLACGVGWPHAICLEVDRAPTPVINGMETRWCVCAWRKVYRPGDLVERLASLPAPAPETQEAPEVVASGASAARFTCEAA